MASFPIESDLSLGGAFGGRDQPMPPTANAREGPHSLQVGPDGDIWITFALGNKMGRFDTKAETWKTYPLDEGYYPHTLRIDGKGRVWFTLAVSNHLGMFDPETETFRTQRLPAGSLGQDLVLRMLPVILWLADQFGGSSGVGMEGGDPDFMPVPYGIDIAPDGSVWFSQLNQHRIGRIDPETFEVEMIDTPFPAPRRLRFDAKNGLWIPSFSSGLLARFDVVTREFKEWTLPTSKEGVETPYSLNVNRPRNEVWICGTNSDTLMRFQPESESFTVYPLPTRVTFTRDIDFDEQGRVWTSNSNLPTWQVEGGFPRVLRLDPAGGAAARPAQLVQGVQP
jgi:streptogramin lyase